MSGERREVRVVADFFADLDRQLGPARGPRGEPSVRDFEIHELLWVVDTFATNFDGLPPLVRGRDDYRVLIASGTIVPRLLVIGQVAGDGAVELVQLDLDLEAGWDGP